jgi:hypothetical protein
MQGLKFVNDASARGVWSQIPVVMLVELPMGSPCQSFCSKIQPFFTLAASQALPPRQSVWPAAPIAVRGVFSPLRALQARPAPAWPQAHRPVGAPDVTSCRGISCSEHFPGQLAVVRAPPPPSGVGTTARHHRASPQGKCQGAELTARDITFSGSRRRGTDTASSSAG